MKRGRFRVRSLRRITAVATAAGLVLASALTSGEATAYPAGGFVPIGNQVDTHGGAAAMAAGDLNHDGGTDVVAPGLMGQLDVLLMQPNGQLAPASVSEPTLPFNPTDLAIGQFTSDHEPDVVAIGSNGSDSFVDVLAGDGAGGLTDVSSMSLNDYVGNVMNPQLKVAVGDFDSDGIDDVVVSHDSNHTVEVLHTNGAGQLTIPFGDPPLNVGGSLTSDIAVGDLNGDKNLDVVAVAECPPSQCPNVSDQVSVFDGNGHGGFAQAPESPYDTNFLHPASLAISDVNSDGRSDVIAGDLDSGQVSVMLATASGTLALAPGSPASTAAAGPIAAGYDRNLAQAFVATAGYGSNSLQVLLADSSGRLRPAPGSPYAIPELAGSPEYGGGAVAVGSAYDVPIVATSSAGGGVSQLINVMADALRSSPPPKPAAFALFNDPGTAPHEVGGYERRLIQSVGDIARYHEGPAQIRTSLYHVADVDLADALVTAARDGASVKVLLDASNRMLGCKGSRGCFNPAYVILKELNGIGGATWMKTCDGLGPKHPNTHVGLGNGCIGQARNHNKFLLVSQGVDTHAFSQSPTVGPRVSDVVVQTSMNNTKTSYRTALNNALVTVNQPAMYRDYVSYFRRLSNAYDARKPPSVKLFAAKFGHRTDTTTLATHDMSTWSFPQAPGYDPMLGALDAIRTANSCANNTAHSAGGVRNGVALAMSRINGRVAVIRRLATLHNRGCNVQVAYAELGARDHHILASAGVRLHRVCLARPQNLHKVVDFLHSKYLLVGGTYRRLGSNRRIVYTGSENLDDKALTKTDDRLVRYVEPAGYSPVFDAYFNNFTHLMSLSHFGHQSTTNCSGDD